MLPFKYYFFLKIQQLHSRCSRNCRQVQITSCTKAPEGSWSSQARGSSGDTCVCCAQSPLPAPPSMDVLTRAHSVGAARGGAPRGGLTLRIQRVQGPAPGFAAPLRAGTRGAHVRSGAPTAAVLWCCAWCCCVRARAGRGAQSCIAAAPSCVCHCRVLLCPQNTLQSPRVLCLQRAPLQRINKP